MNKFLPLLFIIFLSKLTFAQVGIGTNTPKATLDVAGDVSSTNMPDGIIIPRITGSALRLKNASYGHEQNGTLVYVTAKDDTPATKTINVVVEGFYYYHHPTDQSTGLWIGMDTEKKFFYLPSIVLPINGASSDETSYNNQVPPQLVSDPNVVYSSSDQIYTVDLYKAYSRQFNLPIKSSNNATVAASRVLDNANKYEYHILYADPIFTNIEFKTGAGNEGKFTYKVNTNQTKIYNIPPFMNIVLRIK